MGVGRESLTWRDYSSTAELDRSRPTHTLHCHQRPSKHAPALYLLVCPSSTMPRGSISNITLPCTYYVLTTRGRLTARGWTA